MCAFPLTTTLPFRVENLTLTGSNNINATGNNRNNIIIGNSGNNIITGKNGIDELTGMGGNDLFNLAGIKAQSHRKTITDFANGDRLGLSANLTSRAGDELPVLQTVSPNVSVTLDTANADIFVLDFEQTEADVDLGTATNGSEILDGLNSDPGQVNLSTQASGDQGYLLAYDNNNAYLYHFSSGSDTTVKPWEIRLITTLDSPGAIAVGSLDSSHFTFT